MFTFLDKLKLCFKILRAKHEKDVPLFISGYNAGLLDNQLSNKIIREQDAMLSKAHSFMSAGVKLRGLKLHEFKTALLPSRTPDRARNQHLK